MQNYTWSHFRLLGIDKANTGVQRREIQILLNEQREQGCQMPGLPKPQMGLQKSPVYPQMPKI